MATTREELEQLRKEVRKLKTENAEIRRILRENGLRPKNGKRTGPKDLRGLSERDHVLEKLRRAGVIRELTAEEKQHAADWDALPEERKQAVIEKLWTTRFDPPWSESIIEDRG